MTVQMVTYDFAEQFNELLESTEETIQIVSPFIGYKTARKLADWLRAKETGIKCTVITRFYREDFIQNASSLAGLACLIESGAKVLSLKNLHTKLYIFDSYSVIIGSANFTYGGLYHNHEIGILLEDEPGVVGKCQDYFWGLQDAIESNGSWEITLELISAEKENIKELAHKRDRHLTNWNTKTWGAELSRVKNTDLIEDVLVTLKPRNQVGQTPCWIAY